MVKGNFCPFKKQTKCCSANYRTTCEISASHWRILKPTSSIGHSLNCFDAPSFHDSFRFFRHSFILFYQIETSQRVQYRNHHVIIQNKEKASLRQINKQLWKDYKKKSTLIFPHSLGLVIGNVSTVGFVPVVKNIIVVKDLDFLNVFLSEWNQAQRTLALTSLNPRISKEETGIH